MASIRQFLSAWWMKVMEIPTPPVIDEPSVAETPSFVQTRDQATIVDKTGFKQLDPADADSLLDGYFFCKVSRTDDLVGVFSKMFLFEDTPPEEEYSGIVMVAIVKLPLTSDMLNEDFSDRKCYAGEIIYKGKYELFERVSFRGILSATSLTNVCDVIDQHNFWHSMDQARKTILKNTIRPCLKT